MPEMPKLTGLLPDQATFDGDCSSLIMKNEWAGRWVCNAIGHQGGLEDMFALGFNVDDPDQSVLL
jgi:hypothetical protein